MSLLKRLPPNQLGRDFVIGDLHGAISCLDRLLEGLQFDTERDRLISVGDLVDRGPESLQCLELLNEPWFHCVLSNHEQMMLHAFEGGYTGTAWLANGGEWGIKALNDWDAQNHPDPAKRRIASPDSTRLFALLQKVKELPYLITVEQRDGSIFHVIHAEFPLYSMQITDEDLADERKLRDLVSITNYNGEFLIWGRWLFGPFYRADIINTIEKFKRVLKYEVKSNIFANLSQIYSGHTIVTRPLTIGKQTNLDTCAYGSTFRGANSYESLTCTEPATGRFWQATPTEFREAQPVIFELPT